MQRLFEISKKKNIKCIFTTDSHYPNKEDIKYHEAIKCYDMILKINPKHEKALNNKGNALAKLGKFDDAIKCYDMAIKIKPDYNGALYNRDIIYSMKKGKRKYN